MNIKIQSALQAAVILATMAFGYGALENRVINNSRDIMRIEQESKAQNAEFIRRFDLFITEQRELNRQIVKISTNQAHILKKVNP